MEQKRLNFALLCGLGAMVLPFLSGCGNANGTKQAFYYKVEYYTDFAGIDYSKPFDPDHQPDIGKAIRVGHDYVLASTTSSRATHFSDDKIYDPTHKTSGSEAYDKISLQSPVAGYHYSFKGWKGTYGKYSSEVSSAPASSSVTSSSETVTSNPSSALPIKRAATSSAVSSSSAVTSASTIEWTEGNAIDPQYILGDCKLYAYFTSEIDTYTARLYNWDGSVITSVQGDYNKTIGELVTVSDPSHDLGNDPYYKTYTFAGWTNKTDPSDTKVYTSAEIANWALTSDIDFKANYTEATNSYKVSFYNSELHSGNWVQGAKIGELGAISYDTAADFKQATISDPTQIDAGGNPYYTSAIPGQTYQFKGWSGTYDSSLDASIAGKSVDLAHLRADCSVKAVYELSVNTFTVKYMEKAADAGTSEDLLLYSDTVDYGDTSSFKGTLPSVSNKTFGAWTDQAGTALASLTNIQNNLTVYASYADTTLQTTDAAAGTFTYTFNAALSGYSLSAFKVGTDLVLDRADWALTNFPTLYPFKSVNSAVFSSVSLTSVTLPSSVSAVDSNAFNGCKALTNVDFGGNVGVLTSSIFSGCIALTSVNGLTAVTTIEQWAFNSCIALASITLPTGLKSIAANAFDSCTALTSLALPSSLESIGNRAFQNDVKLASLSIPSSVTTLGSYIVFGDTALTGVSVGVSEAVAKTRAYDAKWNYVSTSLALPIAYA
jgi:hypothetical protein